MKRLLILLALTVVLVSTTSCKMIQGAGEDIKDTGNAMEDAVD